LRALRVLCSNGRCVFPALACDGKLGDEVCVGGAELVELMGQVGICSVTGLNHCLKLEGGRRFGLAVVAEDSGKRGFESAAPVLCGVRLGRAM
jgi:hypothetical protein